MNSIYSELDRIFSRAAPIYDSKIQANFINRMIRKRELGTLLKYSRNSGRFLEVGCGTGEESKRLMELVGRLAELTLVDISGDMIKTARKKIEGLNLPLSLDSHVMRASDIGSLERTYDFVYTLNGPLNTEPEIDGFFSGLLKITEPGSYFVAVVRNRICFGEKVIYSVLRKSSRVQERASEFQTVEVVGEKVPVKNYTVKEFLELVPDVFIPVEIRALGVASPPYLAEKFRNSVTRGLISGSEMLMNRLPFFRTLGDQTLYVFERTA